MAKVHLYLLMFRKYFEFPSLLGRSNVIPRYSYTKTRFSINADLSVNYRHIENVYTV